MISGQFSRQRKTPIVEAAASLRGRLEIALSAPVPTVRLLVAAMRFLCYDSPVKNKELKKIISIFKRFPKVKLAYFFGSRATKKEGSLSDYDFAVYLDERNKERLLTAKFRLFYELSRALGTDNVDVVILNLAESPELKFNIINEGILIFEREPFRLMVEPKILNEYFDFHSLLVRHHLTAA